MFSKLLILFLFSFLNVFQYKVYSYKLDEQLLRDLLELYDDDNSKASSDENSFISFSKQISPSKRHNKIGQIGGLATEQNGNLVVFHRASRKWIYDTFNEANEFNNKKYGAINESVIEHINPSNLESLQSWGSGKFYMPHGLTIDNENNIWLTDVGLHQVFKFNSNDHEKPSLVLGVEFENGNDKDHFCKPTDVAILSSNGDIFVSDGYCNSRIVQFDKYGKYIKEFKMKNHKKQLKVPHGVALIENKNLVCVADRENGRIVCFDINTAEEKGTIEHKNMARVFAIEYDKNSDLLHAISGPAYGEKPIGFTFDVAPGSVFGNILYVWDHDFTDPHDITVSPNGHKIYTGELNGEIDEFKIQ